MNAPSVGPGTAGKRVYIGKLADTGAFDPIGDQAGKVHDVVATSRVDDTGNVIGFVVEVEPRKRVFLPLTRVTSIEAGSVITTSLLNMQSSTQCPVETLVLAEFLGRVVVLNDGSGEARIFNVAVERRHPRDWVISRLHVRRQRIIALGFARSGGTLNVRVSEVSGLLKADTNQAAISPIAQAKDMRPAGLTGYLHGLPVERQMVIAQRLPGACLVDVLEELGDDGRIAIVLGLEVDRAVNVLDAMQPDDAADLASGLPKAQAQAFLSLMGPEEVKDIHRLLSYTESVAGSLITTDPVILGPDVTVAQMLASVRREDLPTSLATVVFITRPSEETPTGPYPGMIHTRHALHELPQALLGTVLDSDIETISPQVYIVTVARLLATYNLTVFPVVDEDSHLFGVVSVDNLLDELLPED